MSEIDDYIRANRDRYTREAITQQLLDAGHDRAAVDAAWEHADSTPASGAGPAGWRPRWIAFLVLVILGAVGAALVWADDRYGAGIAPVAYVVIVSLAYALGKGMSMMVDAGKTAAAGIVLAVVALLGAGSAFASGLPLVALAVALLAGIPALLLLYLRHDADRAGFVGAAIPILAWLAVTGTCYAPLLDRMSGGA